jgi:hypothetical protein
MNDADITMAKINDKIATAIEKARELGWYEGVEAEKARAREARHTASNPADAQPASFINLAFDSGRIHERYRAEQILLDLQADVPIDGPAYCTLEHALTAIKRGYVVTQYKCQCGNQSKTQIQDPAYEPDVSCPRCSSSMTKHDSAEDGTE